MKCPSCPETTLVMADRQGVEIDYCPACRGIWLDRGELDKLLDRAVTATAPVASAAPSQIPPQSQTTHASRSHGHRDFEDSDYRKRSGYGSGRKKSWLNEIFD